MLPEGANNDAEEIRLDEDTDLPEAAKPAVQKRDLFRKQEAGSGILSLLNLRYIFNWVGPGGHAAQYSVGELESKIYDNRHHNSEGELLLPLSILSRDATTSQAAGRKILHFTDWKARLASQVCLVVVLISCIITPLTFIWGGSWADPKWVPGGRTTMILDLCCDLGYLAYLVLELKMSFMHPSRRVEVVDQSKILEFRLRSTTYVMRAFSATTYLWIIIFNASLLLNLTKLVRIYHFVRLPDPLWLMWDNGVLRELRPLLLLFWLSHWVGCLLAWGGGYREALWKSGDGSPFETTFNGVVVPGWFSLYFMAFVEALYMLTGALDNPLGDGGIRDKNFGALVMVAVFGPVGCIIVAHFIAAVVREQERKFALDIRHEENQAFVKRALENLNVPKELQRRVFSLHHFQKMSHDYEAFEQLFKNHTLSSPLEDAIRVYLYQSVLRSSFFNNKEHSYILAVVRVLEDKAFLPGDYVVRVGEVADEMYFISKGEVSVLVAQGKSKEVEDAIQLPIRKREGDHFGEVALIKGSLRTAWIKAETYVVASCLRRTSIEQIWKYFPQERESLQRQVLQTVMRDAARQATSIRQSVGGFAANPERSSAPSTGLGAAPVTATDPQEAASLDATSLARIERLCESLQAAQQEMLSRLEDLEIEGKHLKAGKQKTLPQEASEVEALQQLLRGLARLLLLLLPLFQVKETISKVLWVLQLPVKLEGLLLREVLILLGPFLDANNLQVAGGGAGSEEEPACLEEVYVRLFAELRKGLEPLRSARPATQVLILPSLEEAVNFHPLPQPPLDIMLSQWLEQEATDLVHLQQMGVRFLSNPAHIEINGIKVSLTSADALSPLLREMVLRPEGRKVEEALRLLLQQRCLFPVVPRDPAQVFEAKAQALDFPWDGAPQICIFPSPLAIMNGTTIENTLFVNPGSLCRQAAPGSFAEFWIQPSDGASTTKDRVHLDVKKLG
ncbi:HCN2 [Symbiodinium natans]|uniref:HCN2 protein n=1 Tax=Symbiodinium natans TaxID=878477 RepID=A0A812UEP8_9DINO|nr:HCN2 [Symbiodinium natans]